MNRSQRHATLATLIVFTLASGDFFRYLLSWYGWGAIVASLLVWAIVELRSLRFSIRRLPWSLTLFLGFALATAVWSLHPPTTLLGVFLQLASAVGGIFLALIRFDTFRRALLWGTQLVVLASFVFEAFVSLVLRRPIYPLWVHYDSSDHPAAFYWSRDLLLDGGRIQGITGNSNLLAMTALLALIVAVASTRRIRSRALAAVTIIAPIVALALTRSATVLVATIAVACVALFIALWRRMPLRHFQITTAVSSLIALALLSVAVLAREQLLAFIGKDSDFTGRFGIWESVIGQAMESPVIGNGFSGTGRRGSHRSITSRSTVASFISWRTTFGSMCSCNSVRSECCSGSACSSARSSRP
ncbi:O-antigen ligase family protein [Humidisolicoccus flavus]|uniref:O-antigen ligase family protein n=1 Tax=Humidisolicoccus flavus TaxID=3111414 RepID=UPI0032536305